MAKTKAQSSTYAFGLYEVVLSVLGIWPAKCQSFVSTCLTIFASVTQITMLIELTGETIVKNEQINPQYMSFMACNFLSLTKILFIRFNRKKLGRVITFLMKSWDSETDPQALKIMMKSSRIGRIICLYQLGSTYFVITPLIIGALPLFAPTQNVTFNDQQVLLRPFPLANPYMFIGIPSWLYPIIFVYQIFELVLTCTGNIGNDCFFFGMAMNLAAEIQCLIFKLETFKPDSDDPSERKISWIVKRHNEILILVDYLEDSFNFIILSIVACNVSQVCFYGIFIIKSLKIGDCMTIANAVLMIAILNFQIFLYSWTGENLSSNVENIRYAVYNSPWYEMTIKNKKELIFIMMRTFKIFNLTAGKVFRMNFNCFKNIVKSVTSYISIMQAIFEC